MARIGFRQGIINHQTDINDNPIFLDLVAGDVDLIISPDPTTITFAHGTKDYIYTERTTINAAWGTFTPGPDYWLYWDLNLATGVRTFGSTTLEPVEAGVAPGTPAAGQMWFNTSTNEWREYSGAAWIEVVRVFSCKLAAGTAFVSISDQFPLFTGSQVGLPQDVNAGSLVFGTDGKPLKDGNTGTFFTTIDAFVTGVPTGAHHRFESVVTEAEATEPLAAFNIVEFSDFNEFSAASPFESISKVYAIIEEDVVAQEIVGLTLSGSVYNVAWDWVGAGADVNDPLYISATGVLQTTPDSPAHLPVAAILDTHTIFFKPGFSGSSIGAARTGETYTVTVTNATHDFITDLNTMDFTGHANADPSVLTALNVSQADTIIFEYDKDSYIWVGGSNLVGLGGTVAILADVTISEYPIITTTVTKTVGAGQDFVTFDEAMVWAQKQNTSGRGGIVISLDDSTHTTGLFDQDPDNWTTYSLQHIKITIKSTSGNKANCTVTFPAGEGNYSNSMFKFEMSEVILSNIAFDLTAGGFATPANDFLLSEQSYITVDDCAFDNFDTALNIDGGSIGYIEGTFTANKIGVAAGLGGRAILVNTNTFTNHTEFAMSARIWGGVIDHSTFATIVLNTNVADYNIPLNEVQDDGRVIMDGTGLIYPSATF